MKSALVLIVALGFAVQAAPCQGKNPEKPKDGKKEPTKEAQPAKGYVVGSVVDDFTLNDVDGAKKTLKGLAEGKKYVLIDFWSRECPAAKAAEPRFVKLHADFASKGVAIVHIASNKKENKADDDVKATKAYAAAKKIDWPILLDVDNKIADVFKATNTPHVFIVDAKDLKVVYAGAFTDSGFSPEKITHEYAREALDALLAGKAPATPSTKAEGNGCGIKRI